MAGLLAAAALADVVGEVTIIEKDTLPETCKVRKGVPQGAHVHTLLGYGVEAMDKLLPVSDPADWRWHAQTDRKQYLLRSLLSLTGLAIFWNVVAVGDECHHSEITD
jgi:hypothetical protein